MSKTLHGLLTEDASDEEIFSLIASGVDVNEREEESYWSPLQTAVQKKRSENIIRALVQAGANVNTYATADDLSDADKEDAETVLMDCECDLTPLCFAIINNDCGMIRLLVELGADVNMKCREDSVNETAPIAFANTKETLETLIQLGVDVNLQYGDWDNGEAYTKLGWDRENLTPECVQALQNAGAV